MAFNDHVSPREAVRADLRAHLRELVEAGVERVDVDLVAQAVEGALVGDETEASPLWQGVPVLTVATLEKIMRAVFDGPLPPASAKTAEIATPGTVFVSAICPRCQVPQRIPLTVGVELHQDDSGETLHLKGKSKPAIHSCGQLPLPEQAADDDEQPDLGLDETTEDEEEPAYTGPRLLGAGDVVEAEYSEAPADVVACRLCHCTDVAACEGGCSWVEDPEGKGDLCSACLPLLTAEPAPDAHLDSNSDTEEEAGSLDLLPF